MKKSTTTEVNELFREARVKSGITQMQLAKKLGYKSPQLVSSWERGHNSVPRKNFRKLANILDVSKNKIVTAYLGDVETDIKTRFLS